MSKRERKPVYGTSDIGKQVGDFTITALHEGSGGAIGVKKLPIKSVKAEVVDAEFIILLGAMGAPIAEIWMRIETVMEDEWNGEGDRTEVNLLHFEDGIVLEFMSYDPVEKAGEGEAGHMGIGASKHFKDDQEARLKFLTKFGMNDSDFNELNPPWEYPCG